MRFVLCTTRIRPTPTTYPPFGSLAIIQSLRKAGFDPYFYDIDCLRPSDSEIERFFKEFKPDVVGISAVVSTAYSETKRLAAVIKRVAPQARIVVGGNLAASAEILHRFADIDVCVAGEGEVVIVNLLKALERSSRRIDEKELQGVKGITFLGADGEMHFTGYESAISADEVFKPDYSIIEQYSKVDNYIKEPWERADFTNDPRTKQPHRKGKKMGTLVTAKGCVARCTFCHRWDKGYRPVPVDQIIDNVKHLMDNYNVGFITFTDENFGSDKRQTRELLKKLKPLDILWQVGGVRVRSADPQILKDMHDAGCVAVYYGMETGSPKMLEVMEKKATLQDNLNAAKWTREAGIYTIYQLVIAMPGETAETIQETADFLKKVTEDDPVSPRSSMSLNFIQALPGTPVYEFARHRGLIGKTLEDEERYLVEISDTDAADDTKVINFTDEAYLTVRAWRRTIVFGVMKHYHDRRKTPFPSLFTFIRRSLARKFFGADEKTEAVEGAEREQVIEDYNKGGYFNLQRDLKYDIIVAYFYPFRNLLLALWIIQDDFKRFPFRVFLGHVGDWLSHRFLKGHTSKVSATSLRKIMTELTPPAKSPTEKSMQPLREGR